MRVDLSRCAEFLNEAVTCREDPWDDEVGDPVMGPLCASELVNHRILGALDRSFGGSRIPREVLRAMRIPDGTTVTITSDMLARWGNALRLADTVSESA